MITIQHDTQARLARIEAALVQSAGLLRCIEQETNTAAWHSQIEEKREMLQQAALDTMALQQDIVMTSRRNERSYGPIV